VYILPELTNKLQALTAQSYLRSGDVVIDLSSSRKASQKTSTLPIRINLTIDCQSYACAPTFWTSPSATQSRFSNPRSPSMTYKLLIGGYTNGGLRVLTFDPANEQQKLVAQESTISAGPDPSWIIQHPGDPSLIFAANEIEDGKVTIVKLAGLDVSGEIISSEQTVDVSSGGRHPAHLLVLKDSVIVGNVSDCN
jgi:hypothetical protein